MKARLRCDRATHATTPLIVRSPDDRHGGFATAPVPSGWHAPENVPAAIGRVAARTNDLDVTIEALRRLASSPELLDREDRYGGALTLGGFSTLDTRGLLSERIYSPLLAEFRALVPEEPGATQQSFHLPADASDPGPVADLLRAHRDLCLAILRREDSGWVSHGSSLLVLNQPLQSGFHDHRTDQERADPKHDVCRQNAVAAIHRDGTIFAAPTDDPIHPTRSGDTTIFNEGARHQSPPSAEDGLFILHWFAKVT